MLLKLLLTPPSPAPWLAPWPGQPAGESQEHASTVDFSLEADSSFLEAESSFLEADSSSLILHVANSTMITQPTGPDNLQVMDGWLAHRLGLLSCTRVSGPSRANLRIFKNKFVTSLLVSMDPMVPLQHENEL